MFDAATIGSATRDAFFEGDFPLISWRKTGSGKAYLLPFGEKLEVKKVYFTSGGNAANASVTFARQGFKTACAARTGMDVSAEEIRRRLAEENIETKFLVSTPDAPTSYSVLLLEKGERTILNYRGASDSLPLRQGDFKKLMARWWYLSLPGESHSMLKPILEFARQKNIAVAFNPSGHHIRRRRSEILSGLKNLSFLVLNEEEAALLTGIPFKHEKAVFKKLDGLMPGRPASAGRASLKAGILAVTDGRAGATISDGRFIYKAGIFREKKLIDRTGAGDAFGSGFVAGLLRRGINRKNIDLAKPEDVKYAIRLATANATAVVEKIGATEGILTKKEFESNKRWRDLRIGVKRI